MIRSTRALPIIFSFLAPVLSLDAADEKEAAPRIEAEILKSIKLPDGYEATVFAMPPGVGYPTSISAAVDGVLFVAIDENGSIDTKPNRGRVLRCIDVDGDGRADKITVFAEMNSPRGVIWDGPSGTGPGTLYVMHPPNLTAYHDDDGDGKVDRNEELVTGLGFDLKFRGADHTTNGCRLAIDGFIYIAVGDYGYFEAKGKDGTTIRNRGGGIVRVRTDGTGLEIVSRGQRNIYDVAVSPTLDLFTRDNTNDGGGWDVRLSFVPPGAHMGYPTLFKNFQEDMLQPLADYGGGSPCGALWIDEPGLQNGLYTVEWGRNAIMYHPLTPQGAGWKAGQQEWLKIVRPTDMDVDGAGRIYISSWEGATFTYNGPNAGYVLRVVKKNKPEVQMPDLRKNPSDEIAAEELVPFLASKSGVIRHATQRELVRRIQPARAMFAGVRVDKTLDLMEASAKKGEMAPAYAAYWLFIITGRQWVEGFGMGAQRFSKLPADWRLLEMRAIGDPTLDGGSDDLFAAGLADEDPRVRAAAITAVRRKSRTKLASAIVPLAGDEDPVVSHLAIRALTELKAWQVCLVALDSPPPPRPETTTRAVAPAAALGALRALYAIYEPAVVDGLITRLPNATGDLRRGILNALCRLDNQDAAYLDPKEWWGTRPDTSGPVYKPVRWQESEKIEVALKREVDSSTQEQARWLLTDMYRTKVHFPGLVELMLAKAGADTAAKLNAIEGLFRQDNSLPEEAADTLQSIASNENENPEQRAKALRFLQRGADHGAVFARAVAAFAPLAGRDLPHPALTAVIEDFTRDVKNTKWIGDYARAAEGPDAARRTLAQTVLVNLATSNLVKGKEKEKAESAVEKAWSKPETASSLLSVIARTKAKPFADQVRAHLKDPNNAVAEAALFAYQSLGLSDTGAPVRQIGAMKYEEIAAAVVKGGDAAQGKQIFLRAGCIACHTTTPDEPAKGPIMSAVAKIYDRATLAESILKPNAKIAQGFESQWFKTGNGEQVEGFVTREGGDSLDVRNVVGQTVTLEKANIAERGKREQSMMPEGLLNTFSPEELASLLAYLESLKSS